MRALLGALLLTAAPASATAQAPASVAGSYEIDQMEMAGALLLQPNGHFRYALEYGAVSERGEGDWTLDGGKVHLTSNPMPKPPSFELVKDEPAPKEELYISLEPPGLGDWTGRLDLLVTIAGRTDPLELQAGDDGRVPLDGMVATAVQPIVPIYGNVGEPIRLTRGGHRLLVRFRHNDLGKARFDREPLAIEGSSLIMKRFDATITFRPVQPRPR